MSSLLGFIRGFLQVLQSFASRMHESGFETRQTIEALGGAQQRFVEQSSCRGQARTSCGGAAVLAC